MRTGGVAILGWGSLALIASGCLPIPHIEHDAPAIDGTLLRDGVPVSGARATLMVSGANQPHCEDGDEVTTTDAQGRFHFDRHGHIAWWVGWVGEPWTHFGVCFELPEGTRAKWSEPGVIEWPPREVVACELNRVPSGARIRMADFNTRFYGMLRPPRANVCTARDVQIQGRPHPKLPPVEDDFP